MDVLEKYRKAVKISEYVVRHLESLARTVELGEARTTYYTNLTSDLKALYPEGDAENLARAIITEACRAAYLKQQDALKVKNYMADR